MGCGRRANPGCRPRERFNAAAQSLQFLEYLLEAPERAVTVSGGPILVNVPAPARFVLHKLVVAALRPAALQAKALKDRAQALADRGGPRRKSTGGHTPCLGSGDESRRSAEEGAREGGR